MQPHHHTPMQRLTLGLTAKIVLLVTAMGLAFAMITGYGTWQIQRIETQYHALLQEHSDAVHQVAQLRQHLGDAVTLVHTALTVRTDEHALSNQEQLLQIQQAFHAELQALRELLPHDELVLDTVATQAKLLFTQGERAISTHLRWQGARALQMLAENFTPTADKLQQDMELLRDDAHEHFEREAQTLIARTQTTLSITNWVGWLSVLLISAYAAWLAWRTISRPITKLTHSMQRLSQHHYDTVIAGQERQDEIGTMARTLQSFAHALQEAQQLEQQLREEQQKNLLVTQLQQLTSALPGAVFQLQLTTEGQLQLRFVSPQWAQLMGLPPDADTSLEAAIQTIRSHDTHINAVARRHYLESAKTLEPVDFEVSVQMLDGVTRWLKTRANPHVEADGSIVFNGVWLDVTKEVMQAQALSKAKRQAEQNAAERSALQATISHEIRTPLNAILGLTQLLLKADLPEAQREQLHNVLRASQHLRGIVNEVLDFSKIDAGQLQLESTDFSLETVVLDVLRMCQEEASKKGLELHYAIAREVPDNLRGDPHRIAQILLNYVNNAIKFTAAGHIHIAIRLDAGSNLHRIALHVSVKDTGPGIPADRIPLLFEAFQQADNSITRRFGGTGLGLTISRALAQLMGGTVGVDSTVGVGSTFWFTAVLEPARSVVPRQVSTRPSTHSIAPAWQGLRVLVVDDNALNRAVAEGMLNAIGLQTEVAEDGAQALMKLQSLGPNYFSCVLMDVQMPHMDGLSATKALRQLPGFDRLPVIAMTAHAALEDVERSHAAGMNAHLSKPLMESALHSVLQEWLGTSQQPTTAVTAALAATQPEALPPLFDSSAIDALAQLFDQTKLQELVTQFTVDTQQRAQQLPALAQQSDWQSMRAEAHKLTGTAATFGLMRLGHYSSALSAALKASDAAQATKLAQQVHQAAQAGIQELTTYCPT